MAKELRGKGSLGAVYGVLDTLGPNPYARSSVISISVEQEKKCIDCRTARATRDAGKSGRPGNDLCDACWKIEHDELGGSGE